MKIKIKITRNQHELNWITNVVSDVRKSLEALGYVIINEEEEQEGLTTAKYTFKVVPR